MTSHRTKHERQGRHVNGFSDLHVAADVNLLGRDAHMYWVVHFSLPLASAVSRCRTRATDA